MAGSTPGRCADVSDRAGSRGLGYLGGFLSAQAVVFVGFWAQVAHPDSNLQLTIAITVAAEVGSIFFAFRLYQLRHPT